MHNSYSTPKVHFAKGSGLVPLHIASIPEIQVSHLGAVQSGCSCASVQRARRRSFQ
jgi:hypothetical protein